ncbi:MAG: DUF7249 family protein [Saprospiraceae bacterium]
MIAKHIGIDKMQDKTYNGWANEPTWLVNLWLTNDCLDQAWLEKTTRHCLRDAANKEDTAQKLADELVFYVSGLAYAPSGLICDLMTWALDQVDWQALARHHLDSP